MIELKCKKCNGDLILDECNDTIYDDDSITNEIVGYCEKCGAGHRWFEVYKLTDFEDLEYIGECNW